MTNAQFTVLKVSQIRRDGGTQSRVALDPATVMDYTQAMIEGAEFPPAVVFFDGKDYWLADGFHRIEAAVQANFREFPVEVRQGSCRDALLYSVGANSNHGLRRSNADKRRSVLILLRDAEWQVWSDREISRRAGVSDRFVNQVRSELTANGSQSPMRMGADGRVINTAKIGNRPASTRYANDPDMNQDAPSDNDYSQDVDEPDLSSDHMTIGQRARLLSNTGHMPALSQWEANQAAIHREANLVHTAGAAVADSIAVIDDMFDEDEEEDDPFFDDDDAEFDDDENAAQEQDRVGDEWCTPVPVVEDVRAFLGTIDLDPASNPWAQARVKATVHYTQENSGLLAINPWNGRVFMNPPYSTAKIKAFTKRLILEYQAGNVTEAVVIVNNCTDTAWFHALAHMHLFCLTSGRIKFEHWDREKSFQTRQGQAIFYLGPRENDFITAFSKYGIVVEKR